MIHAGDSNTEDGSCKSIRRIAALFEQVDSYLRTFLALRRNSTELIMIGVEERAYDAWNISYGCTECQLYSKSGKEQTSGERGHAVSKRLWMVLECARWMKV